VGLPSIASSIDFDLESDSFSDFGPANGRLTAKITDSYLMISTCFDKDSCRQRLADHISG
jgi:hypothetical protein